MDLSQPGGPVYWHRAGVLVGARILPSIYHTPNVYFFQHRKDFVVALARP